jgi:hypothetical protein
MEVQTHQIRWHSGKSREGGRAGGRNSRERVRAYERSGPSPDLPTSRPFRSRALSAADYRRIGIRCACNTKKSKQTCQYTGLRQEQPRYRGRMHAPFTYARVGVPLFGEYRDLAKYEVETKCSVRPMLAPFNIM